MSAPPALTLEIKDQQNETPVFVLHRGGSIALTPPIDRDYWTYRVKLGGKGQAIVGFPKFGTIGIGFAQEKDWNTNLPYTTSAAEIYDHIAHNKGDDAITREACIAAIEMVQQAATEARS